MTPKIKERLLNWGVSALTAFTAVFISFTLFSGDAKDTRINDKLEQKAPYDYVDKQDATIQKNLDDFKVEQNQRHISEYEQTDRYLKLMMDHFKIEYKDED